MRTIQTIIYKFEELSDKAKQRAKDDYAETEGYISAQEAMNSLEALAKHFGGKLTNNYEIDFFNTSYSSATFDMPDLAATDIQSRLDRLGTFNPETLKGDGDCKLTGYCADEDAIDGFRIAWILEKETDLDALMQAAFRSWLEACQADCADFYSDETFGEHCEANEYEFYESGKMAPRGK